MPRFLVPLSSLLLMVIAVSAPAADEPEKIIESLKKAGAFVGTDPADPKAAIEFTMGANATDKELELVGQLKTMRKVNLPATANKITDKGAAALAHLPELEELHLVNSQVTNTGLGKLAGLKKLKKLNVNRTKITDAGVGLLKDFEALEWLDIGNNNLSVNGLNKLAECKGLKTLFVSDLPSLTDPVLDKLAGLPNLERLEFARVKVTDKGLVALKKAPLQRLVIVACDGVTDNGIKTLGNLPKLTDLEIWNCKGVTDKSVADFGDLKQLEKLRLTGSGVTRQGADKIQKLLPNTQVTR